MIAYVEGMWKRGVVVTSVGIGYQIRVDESTINEEQPVALWVATVVRENSITLYGFHDRDDVAAFEQLLTIIGVGPGTAMGLLTLVGRHRLANASQANDPNLLGKVKGVGPKLAARIVSDYKPPESDLGSITETTASIPTTEVVDLLVKLGFDRQAASQAAHAHSNENEETMLSRALDDLMKGRTR